MTQYDAVSFFAFVLIASVFASTVLWNLAVRHTPLKPMRLRSGLLFVLSWFFFAVTVLVLIEAFRNMLQPGLWADEQLFHGFAAGTEWVRETSGLRGSPGELLYGWALFPFRKWSMVVIAWEGIAVGVVTFSLVLITVELLGRLSLKRRWQSRWTPIGLAAFAMLYAMTYSSVALTRQLFWLLF